MPKKHAVASDAEAGAYQPGGLEQGMVRGDEIFFAGHFFQRHWGETIAAGSDHHPRYALA